MAAGFLANENKPVFKSHDRYGNRIDLVEFHPAYHELMASAIAAGIPSLPWTDPRPGAQVARAALNYLHNQPEAGNACPLTMTYASVPALKLQPDIAEKWLPKILSTQYDPRNLPMEQKSGVTIGMAMTEKQGGTDVRANTTRAHPVGIPGPGQAYELVGHKWFCSAPMCDAFLTLAYTDKGLSCFLLPRHRPDGTRNQFYIQRLKNKLGNWANASSEVEYRGALAWMIGEEGRGVPTIIEMVSLTRFDCMIGSSSLMRQALTQAAHHCAHRKVGGRVLAEQPLMQNVLADLALESEAALALTMRMGRALDHAHDEQEDKFARLVTAVGKYWICKRAPAMINEAQECMGGAGYVEETILPRLYREAPVNSIWEGSGNVQCLDVLRALSKEPGVLDALFTELGDGHGDARLAAHIGNLKAAFHDTADIQYRARQLTEDVAVGLQAKLLLEAGNATVSDAFIASRLGHGGRVYGTLPRGVDVEALVARSTPHLV
jgi:putative acyl-CoA dehydrogenase